MTIARVVLDVPLAREFDYLAGEATAADVGQRVVVPFGQRTVLGILVGLVATSDVPDDRLRPIQAVLRETPALPDALLQFLRFCASYYHQPIGQVMIQALPPALRRPVAWKPRKVRRRSKSPAPGHHQHVLTAAQQQVVETIGRDLVTPRFAVHLLQGITGSGKTEVYLALAQRVLEAGRLVLLLVPEINLTPQLLARVQAQFPAAELLELHSQLAATARVRVWLALFEPGPRVVVATRLAILCPLPDLGLVVVDEEHDASYKQQEGLRYSARDLAVLRARDAECVVVLGSATPSLESLAQVQRGRYQAQVLAQRADPRARPPRIELVDTTVWPAVDGLSEPAITALSAALERREQSLVFLNRRGFSPALWCGQCAWMAACPRCSGRLVVHLRARQCRCHLCGLQKAIPRHCPHCGNADLRPAGDGTQRLEARLRSVWPSARVLRVDADTMSGKDSFETLRADMLEGRVDMAVGTQMLSKGHDFPALTTVVVVNADQALFSADFRASERLLSQLLQVAGRAGRAGLPGRVFVQTAHPAHPVFQALLQGDYLAYANVMLDERRLVGFPPYSHQALLRADGLQAAAVEAFLARAAVLAPAIPEVELFDAVPAPIGRVANRHRFQLLVQAPERHRLQTFLTAWVALLRAEPAAGVHWVMDVDPVDI